MRLDLYSVEKYSHRGAIDLLQYTVKSSFMPEGAYLSRPKFSAASYFMMRFLLRKETDMQLGKERFCSCLNTKQCPKGISTKAFNDRKSRTKWVQAA